VSGEKKKSFEVYGLYGKFFFVLNCNFPK